MNRGSNMFLMSEVTQLIENEAAKMKADYIARFEKMVPKVEESSHVG